MKSVIFVAQDEFKTHFEEIMERGTKACLAAKNDVAIMVNVDEDTYKKVVVVKNLGNGGHSYSYNESVLKECGMGICGLESEIKTALRKAFKESGLTDIVRGNKKTSMALGRAFNAATDKIVELIQNRYEIL